MPPLLVLFLGLSWLERGCSKPQHDHELDQIDTVVPFQADAVVPDAVTIEPPPQDAVDEERTPELGAGPRALAMVKDDTVFRESDREAWFDLWQTIRSADDASLRRAHARSVSFAELYSQPKSFRGRLVRFEGALRRLQYVEAPANDFDIPGYWQGWLRPTRGPPSPIVVYFLTIPDGFPHGMAIDEPVEVVGYFFKRWAYQATDTIRTAPLVMAREPFRRPRPDTSSPFAWVGAIAIATMTALIGAVALAGWLVNRPPPPRPVETPADLSATLEGLEPHSVEQELRKLSEQDRSEPP